MKLKLAVENEVHYLQMNEQAIVKLFKTKRNHSHCNIIPATRVKYMSFFLIIAVETKIKPKYGIWIFVNVAIRVEIASFGLRS